LFETSDNKEKFEQIHSYWWAELNYHRPDVPIILVGSESDLRDQKDIETIPTKEGQVMAEKIGVANYLEMSSLENRGVTDLFKKIVILDLITVLLKTERRRDVYFCNCK
jgi:GTPase SAR1 family protein